MSPVTDARGDTGGLPLLHSAPLAEITTAAFRRLLYELSPSVRIYSEMISARALLRGGMHNDALLSRHADSAPVVWQLLGDDAESMARATERLCFEGPLAGGEKAAKSGGDGFRGDGIDINMGCSAPEIRKQGLGAALLKDVPRAIDIVRGCRQFCKGKLSVKMRAGFENCDAAFVRDFIGKLACEGVDYVTLHARSAKDAFRRIADWKLTEDIAKTSPIPVVGNGDIVDYRRALSCLEKVPAVMIGRAMISQPWIFAQIGCARGDGGEFALPLRECALSLILYTCQMLPAELHKSRLQRFFGYYCRSLTFGHALFTKIRNCSNADSIETEVRNYFERNPEEIRRTVIL